jgi:hypothetical protein
MAPVENGIPIINKEAPSENIVKIDLFGRQFQFRADSSLDDPEKVVEKLKRYVTQAEQGTKGSGSAPNTMVTLLLAGMNLANDLAAAELELSEFHDSVDRKSSGLLNKLNTFVSNAG